MDSHNEHYKEKWEALRREYDAKAEKLSAEARLKYASAMNDIRGQMDSVTDWTEALWHEYVAKVEKKWHEFAEKHTD